MVGSKRHQSAATVNQSSARIVAVASYSPVVTPSEALTGRPLGQVWPPPLIVTSWAPQGYVVSAMCGATQCLQLATSTDIERGHHGLGKTGPVTTNETKHSGLRQAAVRVPEVTVIFWVTKGLATGMGESSSDYLVHRLPPVLAVALGGIALLGALGLQFAAGRYVPWIYWLAVAMVGVFGTMAADVLHVGLGVPYVVSTSFFAVA